LALYRSEDRPAIRQPPGSSRPDSLAAPRAERSKGTTTVFQSGTHTACEPPKWQVKAERIIHDEAEKMIYFDRRSLWSGCHVVEGPESGL
jgi:hypothetical protein